VNDTIYLFVPNIFTPNWDGINDRWEIFGIEHFPDVRVTIVDDGLIDRTVFESVGYEKPWDGKYKDKQLKDGKYYYEIDLGEQMHTGYVCIFTIIDYEGEYRDCLRECWPIDAHDIVFQ
jgi:gliding motility-associated-like protein